MVLTASNRIIPSICLLALFATSGSCSDRDLIPMQVTLSRSVSKLPFVIALDQGLYEKYGLRVEVRMEEPAFEGGISMPSDSITARIWRRLRLVSGQQASWSPNIRVSGANAAIVRNATRATEPHWVSVAATDCVVRQHIVAKDGIERLEDLKGKRLGVSSIGANTDFVALLLAERMGWDPVQDLSIMQGGNDMDDLRDGRVDALVVSERLYAAASQEGFPVLVDTSTWGEPMAGNSVMVTPEWLSDPRNREAARRFLQATTEGIALFHQDRELVLKILEKWHGITDRTYAEKIYDGGRWIPRKPYPCYDGIIKALERYDSNEMRRYSPEDFYDDSLIRELDESGFIDSLYVTAESRSP